jgi:hypothetical protein
MTGLDAGRSAVDSVRPGEDVMSKLMWIAGILLAAAGLAVGLLALFSAASLASYGIGLDLAALLLVGGILSLGLGSVISLLDQQRALLANGASLAATAPAAAIPEFGRKTGEAAAAAVAVAEVAEVSEPTRDTIKSLDQARQKIEQAFEPKSSAAVAPPQDFVAPEVPDGEDEEPVPGQLYVVEERFIRLRPARILSDGTVEAETEEGWMRFENLEHLDEYLDAAEPAKG